MNVVSLTLAQRTIKIENLFSKFNQFLFFIFNGYLFNNSCDMVSILEVKTIFIFKKWIHFTVVQTGVVFS